jgi:hypothetical protein
MVILQFNYLDSTRIGWSTVTCRHSAVRCGGSKTSVTDVGGMWTVPLGTSIGMSRGGAPCADRDSAFPLSRTVLPPVLPTSCSTRVGSVGVKVGVSDRFSSSSTCLLLRSAAGFFALCCRDV